MEKEDNQDFFLWRIEEEWRERGVREERRRRREVKWRKKIPQNLYRRKSERSERREEMRGKWSGERR